MQAVHAERPGQLSDSSGLLSSAWRELQREERCLQHPGNAARRLWPRAVREQEHLFGHAANRLAKCRASRACTGRQHASRFCPVPLPLMVGNTLRFLQKRIKERMAGPGINMGCCILRGIPVVLPGVERIKPTRPSTAARIWLDLQDGVSPGAQQHRNPPCIVRFKAAR